VAVDRVTDLLLAERRLHGIGGDHEGERLAGLDRRPDSRREDLGVADTLDVDPHVLAARTERLAELSDEGVVPARLGDEDVCHERSSVAAGRSYTWSPSRIQSAPVTASDS
jgi:hypothetical protein